MYLQMFQCFYFFLFTPYQNPNGSAVCDVVSELAKLSKSPIMAKNKKKNKRDILLKSFNGNMLAEYFLLKSTFCFQCFF